MHSRIDARTRADPLGRGRSRTGGCAVPGMGTTTTPSPVGRRKDSTTASSPTTWRNARTGSTCGCRSSRLGCARFLTSSSRPWSLMASTPSSAWSATRTSASPTPYVGLRSAASSASSASGTRELRRSRRARTASSPGARRRASRSPARARRTCSPACTTRGWTERRRSPSPGRSRRRCADGARSRILTFPAVFRDVAVSTNDRRGGLRPCRAGGPGGQARDRWTRRRPPGASRRSSGAAVRRGAGCAGRQIRHRVARPRRRRHRARSRTCTARRAPGLGGRPGCPSSPGRAGGIRRTVGGAGSDHLPGQRASSRTATRWAPACLGAAERRWRAG